MAQKDGSRVGNFALCLVAKSSILLGRFIKFEFIVLVILISAVQTHSENPWAAQESDGVSDGKGRCAKTL